MPPRSATPFGPRPCFSMIKFLAPAALLLSAAFAFQEPKAVTQAAKDRSAIAEAVENYVDAFYLADPGKLDKAISKDLHKIGFWRPSLDEPFGDVLTMTFDEAKELAGQWNKDGQRGDTLSSTIEFLDVADKTAAVKLTAIWGIDYIHLAKLDGDWRMVQVLWQSPPVEAPKKASK